MRLSISCFCDAKLFTYRCGSFTEKFGMLVMLKKILTFLRTILQCIMPRYTQTFRRFWSFNYIPLCSARCIDNVKVFVLLPNIIKCAISCDNIDRLFLGGDIFSTVSLWLCLVQGNELTNKSLAITSKFIHRELATNIK